MRKRDWSNYVPISTRSVGDSANVFDFVFLYVRFDPTMFYFPFVFQSQISYLPQFPVHVQTFWPFDPVQVEWYIQTEMVPTPTICTAVGAYLPVPTWNWYFSDSIRKAVSILSTCTMEDPRPHLWSGNIMEILCLQPLQAHPISFLSSSPVMAQM